MGKSVRGRYWLSFATLSACVVALVTAAAQGQDQPQGQVREFTVVGDHYTFTPSTLAANKGDVVKVTFTAKDIAHSFTIDGPYRISKRAAPGQSVIFEFRADSQGSFPIYCNLTADPKCKDMKGILQVR
jgi:heme/copper-type cytochrome/quinol oxidase subunit 2